MEQIDRIVKENVDRAVRAKDKQIAEMIAKFKEQ
jgi:predicted RNase H-like nuclease (RuvC/YqgF family)